MHLHQRLIRLEERRREDEGEEPLFPMENLACFHGGMEGKLKILKILKIRLNGIDEGARSLLYATSGGIEYHNHPSCANHNDEAVQASS